MTQPSESGKSSSGLPPELRSLPIVSNSGPLFWRSLDELAGNGPDAEALRMEFEDPSIEVLDEPTRRDFLRYMAASLALGGIGGLGSGCAYQPDEAIVPYVEPPDAIVPGKPLFFASTVPIDGYGCGVLVKSHMGRPINLEGNPAHPASRGAVDVTGQASILTMYDPERSQLVTLNARVDTWEHLQSVLLDSREKFLKNKGAGLRILTQTVTSPTLGDQFKRLLEQFPEAKWHLYEPVSRDAESAGCRLAFGEEVVPVYHFENADVIFSLDCDFLSRGPGRLNQARAFAGRREVDDAHAGATMNRLYVIEPTYTITGAAADHRLSVAARDVALFAQAIAAELKVEATEGTPAQASSPKLSTHANWIQALARDLAAHRGKSLVLAGETQPAEIHALAQLINHALGNVGKTVDFIPRIEAGPTDQVASIRELAADATAGKVDTLIILGGNPAYDAPADVAFTDLLRRKKIRQRIHLGLYENETAEYCQWHVPEAHCLESWSDCQAFDGTVSIQQPLIAPLYKGRTAHELLAVLLGEPDVSNLEIIRSYWKRKGLGGEFDTAWRNVLEAGLIADSASKPKSVTPAGKKIAIAAEPGGGAESLEIVFRPDPTIGDGRWANNGWLQELPKALTKFSWGNAALLSPALARRLSIENHDIVELRFNGKAVQIPAWIMPGQAENSVTVWLGHGRRKTGTIGKGIGVDVYGLRTADALWSGTGLEVKKTSDKGRVAAMHDHFSMEGRELIKVSNLEEYRKNPHFAQEHEHEEAHGLTLYEDPDPARRHEQGEGNSWGMAINLNTCIGCNACVVACQAENNIPVVGRQQVIASREMHWIRVDRYFEGEDEADPKIDFQPVPCMQCEKAPCEVVCPVAATTHSVEGLNEMTYNRCVGTRYCGNNCPYKVRRFNFLHYAAETAPSLKLMQNPEVTVRFRGVMEKCTYCVQRINAARITADIENRPVGGDEVVTACQSACPTKAIVFGNLNDPKSAVVKAKASSRNYALLAELNTRPRTTYLAKLRNPNPEIEAGSRDESHRS
jgi:MoCo/4Fe-4S cofactor protein with predicted Tat translocation signal